MNRNKNGEASAEILHYKNGVVLQASTREYALQKELYRTYDTAAYVNLGRVSEALRAEIKRKTELSLFCQQVLAQRCLESGIIEMFSTIKPTPNSKVEKFLQELEKGGVSLKEGQRYFKNYAYDTLRMDKSWETHVE